MRRSRILVVDDELEVRNFFRYLLSEKGYEIVTASTAGEAISLVGEKLFDLALVDLKLPDQDGLVVLKEVKARDPLCEVIIMTGFGTVKSAIDAIRLGAYDYLEKPFEDIELIESFIEKALFFRRGTPSSEINEEFGFVIGRNPEMRRILYVAEKIANKNITVLIQGETGTGKEVIARYIHNISHRASHPFIAVNCGAFTETLLDSELFGHEKGSFTGASGLRRGVFEIANRGTLFLDEVGAASQSIQVKLLRVLETGEFFRVGGEQPLKTDVRIIAATNVDLREEVAKKNFRSDLFYRLDSASLYVPPLRERKEDIPVFVKFMLDKYNLERTPLKPITKVSPEVLEILMNYSWPGNIRELGNVIYNAVAVAEGDCILPKHLPKKLFMPKASSSEEKHPGNSVESDGALVQRCAEEIARAFDVERGQDLKHVLRTIRLIERHATKLIIEKALKHTLGSHKQSAELLGVTPRVIRYYLRERVRDENPASEHPR